MGFQRTLIVTKKTIMSVWEDEARVYLDNPSVHVANGAQSVAEKARGVWDLGQLAYPPYFVIVNYDVVWREAMYQVLYDGKFDAVIVDESHKIKAHNSNVSKSLWKLGKRIPYRAALTGTPFPNGLMDAYGQFRFLDSRIFGTNFGQFRSRYGVLEPVWGAPGIVRVTGYKNTEEFHAKIAPHMLVVRAEDVLDLPPVHHQVIHVDLSPKGRKAYKEMKKEMITEWRDGTLVADNALVKGLRLSQITGQDTAKPEVLRDLLDGFPPGEPVIVWAKFTDDINAIAQVCEGLGLAYSPLTGKVNDLQSWRDGKTQVIIGQIDTGAEGIDLSRGRYVIYYSNTYNNASYEQSLSRPLKDGKKETIFYYHLIARETIDDDIYHALSSKQSVANAVLAAVSRAT